MLLSWPAGHATVDIDDVAAAHTLAMSIPEAHGRYLLAERGSDIPSWAAMLRWVANICINVQHSEKITYEEPGQNGRSCRLTGQQEGAGSRC